MNYDDLKGINNSSLSYFEKSPAHYQFYKEFGGPEETKATIIGSAYHLLVWEPENFISHMAVLNEHERPQPKKDYRTKENQIWKAEFFERAEAEGLTVISSDDMGTVHDMVEALEKDPEAWGLIQAVRDGGQTEWADQWTKDGVLYKRKVDGRHPDFLIDLKSALDADPREFERVIFQRKYDRQGGMYCDGERIITDSAFLKPFYIIAQEKEPPFAVSVHELSNEVLERGAARYHELGKQIKKCEETGEWPGYASKYNGTTNIINLPSWAQKI